MSGALVRMALACKHCGERADDGDVVLGAWLLHMQVEHDTSDVQFDLVAVCRCGATMKFDGTDHSDIRLHRYTCSACGGRGSIRTKKTPRTEADQ